MESNKENFEKFLGFVGMTPCQIKDGDNFAMGPDGEDSDIQWNETIVYGENYKYKYKEVENISKQMSKELKHYNLKNKVSYKKFLNAE